MRQMQRLDEYIEMLEWLSYAEFCIMVIAIRMQL